MELTVSTAVGKSLDFVPSRLIQHAEERPDQVVLAFLDEHGSIQHSWTFGQLDRRARSIGAHLQQRGLSGEPVALSYPSELEFVAAFCGCLYAGAIAVPTTLPKSHGVDERMAMIVADSGARAVLTSRRYLGAIERRLAEASSAATAIGTDALSDRSPEWAPVEWRGEQLALLQYTSGSTRSPSGVMIRHRNLAANLECLHQVWRTHRDSVSVSWLPLFHDMGLIAGVLQPLWVGYATFLMAPATFVQSPLRWLRAFSRYGGTIGGGPNFAYEACVEAAQAAPPTDLDLSRWELAWNGAEPIRATTLDAFRATFSAYGFRASSLTPGYGLAEATLLVTGSNAVQPALELVVDELELGNDRVRRCAPESARAKRLVSSGRPGPATDLRIVQRDGRVEVGQGEVGEIWVRSDSVGAGYWRKAEETLATFDGRLRSGDG
ncbi:MAG: AMP-binding protein, partial [Vicinamibacterales bacterium]